MMTLQAMCGPDEEAESHACEKLFTLGYRDGDLLPLAEEGVPVFTGQRRFARGLCRHCRRSVLPFPWSIDMYAPVIHV